MMICDEEVGEMGVEEEALEVEEGELV